MNQEQIRIRIVETKEGAQVFWDQLQAYFDRDIFLPGEEQGRERCGSEEYRRNLEALRTRQRDPLYFLYFEQGNRTLGLAMAVIYPSENGKCFILEFCVYPQFRGGGIGSACAWALMDWARQRGAVYFQLNAAREDRRRFWERLGFLPDGTDQWGEPLMRTDPEGGPARLPESQVSI
ncbi:MAG TPA: GNAT family N-acetyltransferase [Candidatus Enterenecus stercoripullorum]|nr:GNAT family N-acetyltransferase [Candidatus Enterenecus stercoripullorum]